MTQRHGPLELPIWELRKLGRDRFANNFQKRKKARAHDLAARLEH